MTKKKTAPTIARKPFLQPVIWKGHNGQWYLAVHRFQNSKELMRVSEGDGYSKSKYCRLLLNHFDPQKLLPLLEIIAGKIYYDGTEINDAKTWPWLWNLVKLRLPKRKK